MVGSGQMFDPAVLSSVSDGDGGPSGGCGRRSDADAPVPEAAGDVAPKLMSMSMATAPAPAWMGRREDGKGEEAAGFVYQGT